MNIKTEIIYKSYKKCQAARLGLIDIRSCYSGGGAQELKVMVKRCKLNVENVLHKWISVIVSYKGLGQEKRDLKNISEKCT